MIVLFVYSNSVVGEKSGIVPNKGNGVYFDYPINSERLIICNIFQHCHELVSRRHV